MGQGHAVAEPRAISLDKVQSLPIQAAPHLYHVQSGRRLTEDYELDGHVLGQGFGGDVVLARGKTCGGCFAMKTIRKGGIMTSKQQQLAMEVMIYITLDHPNVVRLQGVYETSDKICLVMECCTGGELYSRLQERGVYNEADAAEASRQMLRAVGYLHSRNVVHRDLKLENFLYESEEKTAQLKLIDFGFAIVWDPATLMTAPCGSVSYVAPDVLSGSGYTNKCDLWSMGVIVWMLLSGYPPFHGQERVIMAKIKAGEPDWSHKTRWKSVSKEAINFVNRLLDMDPQQRLGASEALEQNWIMRSLKDRMVDRARPSLAGA